MSSRTAPGLTKDEFQQLLARAAERQGEHGPRDFTVAELVEAGQELGIDAQTVREVHLEHQRARERDLARPAARLRPFDSILRLDREGDTICLTIPPRRSEKVMAVVLTLLGAAGVAGVASTSCPWWLVGLFGVVVGVISLISIRAAQTTRRLRLHRDGSGALITQVGSGNPGKRMSLQAGQVHARLDVRVRQTKEQTTRTPFVALDHGTETHELLVGYSHPEQAWVVDEIERWLGR
jgi:hypothetical protein